MNDGKTKMKCAMWRECDRSTSIHLKMWCARLRVGCNWLMIAVK